jgi:hypothetical protein
MKSRIKLALGLIVAHCSVFAQSITLNPADSKNILSVESNYQAIKLPVLNENQRNAIPTPTMGMQIYCSNCLAGVGPYSFNGFSWVPMFVFDSSDLPSYTVGQLAHGGRVIFVDDTGRHGLVVATADQTIGIKWLNANFHITGATRVGIYGGIDNTADILRIEGNGSYAAKIAQSYTGGGFGDWHLPSLEELKLIYNQKNTIGGFADANYWTSTEIAGSPAGNPSITAYVKDFTAGAESALGKQSDARVRAIRKF